MLKTLMNGKFYKGIDLKSLVTLKQSLPFTFVSIDLSSLFIS